MSSPHQIIIASESGISIRSLTDISDVINTCIEADGLVLTENDLAQEFFDLRTGLAGEFFQKSINYGLRVAIVLPAPEVYGERFSELAYEHRSHQMIRIVRSQDEATTWLSA